VVTVGRSVISAHLSRLALPTLDQSAQLRIYHRGRAHPILVMQVHLPAIDYGCVETGVGPGRKGKMS